MLRDVEKELLEIAHDTAAMSARIGQTLSALSDERLREAAIGEVVSALAAVQFAEAQCNGLALAVRQIALLSVDCTPELRAEIWLSSGLDDVATRRAHERVDLASLRLRRVAEV